MEHVGAAGHVGCLVDSLVPGTVRAAKEVPPYEFARFMACEASLSRARGDAPPARGRGRAFVGGEHRAPVPCIGARRHSLLQADANLKVSEQVAAAIDEWKRLLAEMEARLTESRAALLRRRAERGSVRNSAGDGVLHESTQGSVRRRLPRPRILQGG